MNWGDQFFVFLVCTLCGIAAGVPYDFIYCVRYPFRRGWVRVVTDLFFFVAFSGMFLFVSVVFSLPTARFYMVCGCLLGFFLYLKSFHKIVAFFMEKLYNRIRKNTRAKEKEECPKTEAKKRRAVFRKKRREGSP